MPPFTPDRPSTDLNLLFGVLALQMDFVTRDELLAAMNAWVLAKHKPLGQVLADMGALRDDERALLDALVQKHLQRHGGDAEKSLAAVSSVGSVRLQLQQIADPDLNASLAHVSADRNGDADPNATRPPSVGTPTSSGLRFRVLRPHARGGLGEVFVARDEELGREVALKEIQERYAGFPDSRARFVLEAEINGGLEHPGIVPVYGLGTYGDGRPFYAMRFIRGDSLQEAIKRFHAAEGPHRDSSERRLALRGLLGRFVDVCDAVAYAHSRGVLHRDLKPGNVMLGQYGETLVVDWGLAKVAGRPDGVAASAEGTLRPASASGSAETQAGKALGTPQYMPPEQAAGRLDELGPASDVYSLGATLYCLLTGQAPVQGKDVGEVLRRVQRGDFSLPRQVKREVAAALEAVCLKAMARRPEGRYPSPRALAADVEAWLADEPVSAWREPLRLRAGRWARRHQALVAASAAGLLVAILTSGLWVQQRRAESARQEALLRQEVEVTLAQAGRLRQGGHFEEARRLLKQPWGRLGEGGPADLCVRVGQALADTALVEGLDAARLQASTLVEGKLDVAGGEKQFAEVFAAGLGREGEGAETVAARVRASAVRQELVAALDAWAGITRDEARRAWLLAVARASDPEPLRDRVRDPGVWRDRQALGQLAGEARASALPPSLTLLLGKAVQRGSEDAVPLLREAQARHPHDFWLNFELGEALCDAKEWTEAVGHYRAALALRPQAAAVHNNLGNGLNAKGKGKVDEAIGHYERAIALDPKFAEAHVNLGNCLRDKGRLEEAVGCFERAVALDPKFAPAHLNLGNALYTKGERDKAVGHFEQALRLDPKLATAHNSLGAALKDKGRLDEAVGHYREALRLDPEFAPAHCNLAIILYTRGKREEAVGHWEQALRIDPKYAQAHFNLGIALKDRGRLKEAVGHYEQALRIDPKDAQAHGALGGALLTQGRWAAARDATRRCLDLLPQGHPLRAMATRQLQRCERLLALETRLPAVLAGKDRPAGAAEALEFAALCRVTKRHAASARFYADTFAADPKTADDLRAGHRYRYNAACAAALSAAGQGTDAAKFDDKERARLRRQALDWLRADLALWGKQMEKATPQLRAAVQKALEHWQQGPDLAGFRGKAALAKLPEAERVDWQKLWADVTALLKKAEAGGKK